MFVSKHLLVLVAVLLIGQLPIETAPPNGPNQPRITNWFVSGNQRPSGNQPPHPPRPANAPQPQLPPQVGPPSTELIVAPPIKLIILSGKVSGAKRYRLPDQTHDGTSAYVDRSPTSKAVQVAQQPTTSWIPTPDQFTCYIYKSVMLSTRVVTSKNGETIKLHKAILADRDNDNPKDYLNYVWTDGREYYVGMGVRGRPMHHLYLIAIFADLLERGIIINFEESHRKYIMMAKSLLGGGSIALFEMDQIPITQGQSFLLEALIARALVAKGLMPSFNVQAPMPFLKSFMAPELLKAGERYAFELFRNSIPSAKTFNLKSVREEGAGKITEFNRKFVKDGQQSINAKDIVDFITNIRGNHQPEDPRDLYVIGLIAQQEQAVDFKLSNDHRYHLYEILSTRDDEMASRRKIYYGFYNIDNVSPEEASRVIEDNVNSPVKVKISDEHLKNLFEQEKQAQLTEQRPRITQLIVKNAICREIRIDYPRGEVPQKQIVDLLNSHRQRYSWPELKLDLLSNGGHGNRETHHYFHSPTYGMINSCLPDITEAEIDQKDLILREMGAKDPSIDFKQLQAITKDIIERLQATRQARDSVELQYTFSVLCHQFRIVSHRPEIPVKSLTEKLNARPERFGWPKMTENFVSHTFNDPAYTYPARCLATIDGPTNEAARTSLRAKVEAKHPGTNLPNDIDAFASKIIAELPATTETKDQKVTREYFGAEMILHIRNLQRAKGGTLDRPKAVARRMAECMNGALERIPVQFRFAPLAQEPGSTRWTFVTSFVTDNLPAPKKGKFAELYAKTVKSHERKKNAFEKLAKGAEMSSIETLAVNVARQCFSSL